MAKLTAKKRRRMKSTSFALPGSRSYPIDTLSRARNALARVSQFGTAAQQKQVRAKVTKKYPSLKKAR